MSPVADVLRRAVQVLDERGWGQGLFEDGTGKVCSLGAIYVAVGGDPWGMDLDAAPGELADAAENALMAVVDSGVTTWNDHPLCNLEQVKAAFLAAAERAEAAS